MEKNAQEEKSLENVIMNVKGIAKFPFYDEEENKFSMKLLINDETLSKIEESIEPIGEELAVGELSHDDKEYSAINVKTGFAIPIYNIKGEVINSDNEDFTIYDGAKVILKVNFKRYEYKERKGKNRFTKTGVTGYLMGCVILEQGTPFQASTTFEDFAENLKDEEIAF